MEQYDDVCLKITFFFITMTLLGKSTWFWYFAADVSYSHIAGISCLPNSFAIQSTKFWSIKKDQEGFPVGERQKESSRSGEQEIECWYGKELGYIEIGNGECSLQTYIPHLHVFSLVFCHSAIRVIQYLTCSLSLQ